MKKFFYSVSAVIFLFFSLAAFPTQAGFFDFFKTNNDTLNVQGNKIIFNGVQTNLRGVATGDSLFRKYFYSRNETDYDTIKNDWHANTVRISVHPGAFEKDKDNTKEILEKEVKYARSVGLLVIIDWHAIGFPDGWYQPIPDNYSPYNSYNSNFNLAREFWEYAAEEFRGDQGVIFELWNEPADKTKKISWDSIRPWMDRLYGIIRAQGAENVVLASSVHWTYDLRGVKDNPLKGKNIGYVWHVYPGSEKAMKLETALDGLDKFFPVFITEWGFSLAGESTNSHHLTTMDQYPVRMSSLILNQDLNFTAWCWHAIWAPRMFVYKDWQKLTDFGEYTKNLLTNMDNKEYIEQKTKEFVYNSYGVENPKIKQCDRESALNSFKNAFGRAPISTDDLSDVIKISTGRWPSQKSDSAELTAKEDFKKIYKREASENNNYDVSALKILAYGIRPLPGLRNLESEKKAMSFFQNIYCKNPSSAKDWNVVLAIAYSGAKR